MSAPRIDTPRTPARFGYTSRCDGGYDVIALDTGHPVNTRPFDTPQQANGSAQRLNQALAAGGKALARALGAVDGPLPVEFVGSRSWR